MGCALKHLHRNAIVSAFFYDREAAMIFETHAHYDDESFNDDREALIRSLPEKGIGRIINVGASIETTKTTLELAAKYDYIYAAVGVHPSDISGLNEETFAWLKEQALRSVRSDWIIIGIKSQRCRTHSVTGSDGRWNLPGKPTFR